MHGTARPDIRAQIIVLVDAPVEAKGTLLKKCVTVLYWRRDDFFAWTAERFGLSCWSYLASCSLDGDDR